MSKKLQYLIGLSALALIGLVILQINWVNHAAKLREAQFDHRVSSAVRTAIDKISQDKHACNALGEARMCAISDLPLKVENIKNNTCFDSLLNHELKYHKVNIDFEYDIQWFNTKEKKGLFSLAFFETKPFKQSLCRISQASGLELVVRFPDKNRFIYAKMSLMLISSVILILLVTTSFVMTILTIMRQKRIHEMTTEFITNMTHEFKTPLATISLASNMLRKGKVANNPAKATKYADVIHEENQKLREHVEQVLSMAKLEKGEFKLKKHNSCVHNVVQKAIETVDMQVRNRDGAINYDLSAAKAETELDELHMTNVISNLLDNANKYSPERPEITVRTRNENNGIIISVEDKGIGMSKDKQKAVFDKFYRVPTGNVHDVKGFGLGLAYVKMIVDRHDGKVSVKSEPGKGSTFEVFLPLNQPQAAA